MIKCTVTEILIIGASFFPGIGEMMDVDTLVDPNSTIPDRFLAAGSLILNAAFVGVTPNYGSMRAARRGVMRQEGIPTSQQPISQSKNLSGREYSYTVPEKGGGTQLKSVQQQTMDYNHGPHWEAGTVKIRDGAPAMNPYGRARLEPDKSKAYYGK